MIRVAQLFISDENIPNKINLMTGDAGSAALHVEVAVKASSSARFDIIRSCVEDCLRMRMITPHSCIHFNDIEFLAENVESVRTCELIGGEASALLLGSRLIAS
jgi:hypothetical protein